MTLHNPRIGLFYNLAANYPPELNTSGDLHLEWDSDETILDLKDGLASIGCEILDIGDPKQLLDANVRSSVDIVFSICEMYGGRYRESIVPSLCEWLGIPYAFSSPDTMMVSLDKNLCNLVVSQLAVPIPESFLLTDAGSCSDVEADGFPYFLKPSCEGSGIGIGENSIVRNYDELVTQAQTLLARYRQPVLAQRYLDGDDVTVAVIQRLNEIEVLTPLAGKLGRNMQPVKIDSKLFNEINDSAMRIFKYLDCRDVARIDYKQGADGQLFFLEINPLPLFSRRRGYLTESASLSGYTYEEVLSTIIANTITRFTL